MATVAVIELQWLQAAASGSFVEEFAAAKEEKYVWKLFEWVVTTGRLVVIHDYAKFASELPWRCTDEE